MRRIILWVALAGIAVIALIVYRSRYSDRNLKVEPHAREEIEKAKHR